MIGSTIIAKIGKGFVGGYELDLLLLSIAVSLLLTGPGRPSIEWNILNRELFPKGKELVAPQNRNNNTTTNSCNSSNNNNIVYKVLFASSLLEGFVISYYL